jgi:isoquinoline 1-oxidoreductase alpha subunit
MTITIRVNGEPREVDADAATPLLWVLRDHFGMTGTKFGCGIGTCGACTVHVNGSAVRSCQVPLSAFAQRDLEVTTIEGLSPDGRHPLQLAWVDGNVPQCATANPAC